ncbi:MAG: hypothetical protein RLZZ373_3344 [Pseudomonadota bacterium]|jgi:hypothetical protein
MTAALAILGWVIQSRLGVALIAAALGFGAGWFAGAPSAAERTAEHDAIATSITARQQVETLTAALEQERTSRAASDAVQSRLTTELQQLHAAAQDRKHAIASATSNGRDCLRSGALRMLDGSPGISVDYTEQLVTEHTASLADAADATPASSAHSTPSAGERSSESQIAAWIISAGEQYEECRTRLDALIDFIEMTQHRQDEEQAP